MASITGVVLCGGAGRRFQGRDKPLLKLQSRALVAHVLHRLAPQVDQLVISANRNLPAYRRFGHPVIEDAVEDQGPLAGILAAGQATTSDFLCVCPGDAPFLPEDLVERLAAGLAADVAVAVAHDGQRAQPLFLLLRRSSVSSVGDYLQTGERSVRGWLESLPSASCLVDNPLAFTNVNSPEALAQLEVGNWHAADG